MEALQKEGLAKSIGVSNYRVEDLKEVMKTAKVRINEVNCMHGETLIEHLGLQGHSCRQSSNAIHPLVCHPELTSFHHRSNSIHTFMRKLHHSLPTAKNKASTLNVMAHLPLSSEQRVVRSMKRWKRLPNHWELLPVRFC